MRRQYEGTTRTDSQSFEDRYTTLGQLLCFTDQRIQRQHHAVANEAQHAVTQNSRRDQVQYGLLAGNHQRVAGIVAALETRHGCGFVRQEVDNLAFALIAPLRSNDYDVFPHPRTF